MKKYILFSLLVIVGLTSNLIVLSKPHGENLLALFVVMMCVLLFLLLAIINVVVTVHMVFEKKLSVIMAILFFAITIALFFSPGIFGILTK